jgi:hypothetical protein
MRQIREHVEAVTAIVAGILQRPEPQEVETDDKGWPTLRWEQHDDPEQQP